MIRQRLEDYIKADISQCQPSLDFRTLHHPEIYSVSLMWAASETELGTSLNPHAKPWTNNTPRPTTS